MKIPKPEEAVGGVQVVLSPLQLPGVASVFGELSQAELEVTAPTDRSLGQSEGTLGRLSEDRQIRHFLTQKAKSLLLLPPCTHYSLLSELAHEMQTVCRLDGGSYLQAVRIRG